MEIGLFNETKEDLDDVFKTVENVLKIGLDLLNIKQCEFNIIVVDNKFIHELNRKYRGLDRETDVISFALEDDKTFNPESRVLGDIYISIEKAHSQSIEYGHSFIREFCFLSVHGMLHLLGYDHMKKEDEIVMFSLQDEILNKAGITR